MDTALDTDKVGMSSSLEDTKRAVVSSSPPPNMEFQALHQAHRDRWKNTDASMCRHSMSFHLHHSLRMEFFASFLYLLEQIPLVKLFAVTCEKIKGEKFFYYKAQQFYEDVEPSEEGMMGDFVEISHIDLEGSRNFLSRFIVSHLTDRDLMQFLMRCKNSLRPNGVIIIKDNMARKGCKLDPIDSSIIRHLDIMKDIIFKAGLKVLAVEKQEGFPDAIVPVWMIAMQ
ncbi:unnamed protein product [Coregonus sp. 'balchen']|nr:unnamed protein product [Coregonus sp. 'balchen']